MGWSSGVDSGGTQNGCSGHSGDGDYTPGTLPSLKSLVVVNVRRTVRTLIPSPPEQKTVVNRTESGHDFIRHTYLRRRIRLCTSRKRSSVRPAARL